jgi:hypothetical protein
MSTRSTHKLSFGFMSWMQHGFPWKYDNVFWRMNPIGSIRMGT